MTVLVAGIGNLFWGDDAFGSEVARRMLARPIGPWLDVRDFGIRTMDLFFALDESHSVVIVDVVKRGLRAGTLYVIDPTKAECPRDGIRELGGHGPSATDLVSWCLGWAERGERARVIRIVGCEPQDFGGEEGRLGLSEPVAEAVPAAVELVERVAAEMSSAASARALVGPLRKAPCTSSG